MTTLTVKPDGFRSCVRPRIGRALGSPVPRPRRCRTRRSDRSPAAPGLRPVTARRYACFSARTWARPRASPPVWPRGRGTRLRRHPRHARRPRRRPAHRGRRPDRQLVLQRQPPENARAFMTLAQRPLRPPTPARCALHRLRLWRHRLGGDVSEGADAPRRGLEAHGATRIHPRGEGNVGGDFDGQYRRGTATCGLTSRRHFDLPNRSRPRGAVRPAAERLDRQSATVQPGRAVVRGDPGR